MAAPFQKGFLAKAVSAFKPAERAAVSTEATQMAKLRAMKRQGVPYAALEPERNPSNFNVSGFLRGTKTPQKTT